MNMNTKILLAILLACALTSGCTRIAANTVSVDAYTSERDAIVAQNELRKEIAETGKQNQEISRELAEEWKNVAKAEIRGKAAPGATVSQSVGPDGVLGGFPCLFANESRSRIKTLSVKKIGGFMNGQKFIIPVEKNGNVVFKLPIGFYAYTWTVPGHSRVYPENGPRTFNVTATPKSFDLKSGVNYHGGVRLFGD